METKIETVQAGYSTTGRGQITEKNGKLTPPKQIILTVHAARLYAENFRRMHTDRVVLQAAIEGLLQGNPPYDSERLAAAGLAHIANVNTLDAKAIYERAALTFWNLINQTENLVVFEIRPFEIEQDHEWSEWAKILAKNWTKVIKEDWADFYSQMNVMTGQLVKLGLSPIVWSDENDFRWETVQYNKFLVSDNTSVHTSLWDCIVIETPYTMQYIYQVYERFKDDKNSPWNIEALTDYILRHANRINKGTRNIPYTDPMDVQQSLQNGNLNAAAMFSDSVRLYTLLYKEYDGKISKFIFDPVPGSAGGHYFLYEMIEEYEHFEEAVSIFTYNPGEMTLHGNRGIGHKIFPICQGMMQLDCQMLDMAKMAGTMVVSTAGNSSTGMAPIKIIPGVVTDIGNAQLQQNQLGANINQTVSLAQYMENKVNRNAAISGDDPSMPDQDRGSKSAPEAMMQSVQEFGVGKQTVAHFYMKFDKVIKQMVSKMLHCPAAHPAYEISDRWKQLCIDEGVPPEIFEVKDSKRGSLPKHLSVRAARVAGDGSNLGLIMGLNGVAGIAGGFGAKGQYNYRKDVITSRLGADYVDRYLSDSQTPDEVGAGASLASLENIAIKQGEMPQATQDNNHKIHLGSHLAVLTSTIQAVQQQKMDPVAADKVFSIAIPHAQDHMDFLEQDQLNQAFLGQIKNAWRQITKFAQFNRVKAQKLMQAEVRRRQQAEEEMNADMIDQKRKDMVTEREQQRKDFESEQKQARAKEQSDTKAEIMKRGVDKKAENERRKIELQAENEGRVKKPQDLLAGTSTEELQSTLGSQVGNTPNPADFE